MGRSYEEVTGRASKKPNKDKLDPKYATRRIETPQTQALGKPIAAGQQILPGLDAAPADAQLDLAGFNLEFLSVPDATGYLKICPSDDETKAFYYWKWSGGAYAGHYVVCLGPLSDPAYCLTILAEKVRSVEAGHRKPNKDRYMGG